MARQYVVFELTATKDNITVYRLTEDGKINTTDAKLVMQYELHLIDAFIKPE